MKGMARKRSICILSSFFIILAFGVLGQGSSADQLITIAEGVGPQNLDPHLSTVQAALNVALAICEPLLLMDYSKMELKPNLAISWKAIDKTTWEFKLRRNVKFTNGEPFDANSVKYSIERIKDPKLKAPTTILVRPIKEVKVVDSHTVHIVTTTPTPTVPLSLRTVAMVPPRYLEEKGAVEFGKNPVGTGPFQLSKWVKDEYVELKANPGYWNGKAKLDRVVYKSIPETATRMSALRSREADLVSQLMIEEVPSIEKEKDLSVSKIPGLRTMFVQFNMTKESPVLDKRIRIAMNHAVDVDSIIKNVLQGFAVKLNGQLLTKEYDGYDPNLKPYPYDPEKARRLIKEAGYENYEFTLMATTGRYLRDKEVAEAVGGQLNAAGIKTKVRIMEWGGFLEKMLAKELFPMAFWGAATVPAADVFLGAMVKKGAAYSTYDNPEFEKLFDEGIQSIEKEKRQQLFNKMAELLYNDPPCIFLYQQMNVYGVNKRVGGWQPSPDEWIDLYSLYVK